MRTHTFPTASGPLSFRAAVDRLDAQTKKDGLHVLQGWDYVAHRFADETAPVLMLDFCERSGVALLAERRALAILLDHYFASLLSLATVRAWDDGNPNDNLDRVSALVSRLQGEQGSGARFVDDAETQLLLAVSYYHPEERAYDLVLAKVRALDAAHRLRFAIPCAAIMASHLRWGLRFMYRRDVGLMRNDNVVDYPWLLFALLTLMREYAGATRAGGAPRVAEALMDGLSADPWAFTGKAPPLLAAVETEHREFHETFTAHRDALLIEFERQQPDAKRYSPLGFGCNFLSNASVASVVLAVGGAEHPSMNALFTHGADDGPAERFARALMGYSARPERLGAGGAPLIVYDERDAISSYNTLMRTAKA